MATTTQVSSSSVTTAAVIGSFVILAIIVGILAWACSLSSSLSHRQICNTETNNTVESNNPRSLVMYPDEIPPACGFRNVFGRRSLIGSNEVMESIIISPSNPAIFGNGKSAELSMMFVLTPPTPLRNEDSSPSK